MSAGAVWRWTDERGVQRLVSTDELRGALAAGVIPSSTLVWRQGMEAWAPAATVPELAGASRVEGDAPTDEDTAREPGGAAGVIDLEGDSVATELDGDSLGQVGGPGGARARDEAAAKPARALPGAPDGASRGSRPQAPALAPRGSSPRASPQKLTGAKAPGGDRASVPHEPIAGPSAGVVQAILQLPRAGATAGAGAAVIPRAPRMPSGHGEEGAGVPGLGRIENLDPTWASPADGGDDEDDTLIAEEKRPGGAPPPARPAAKAPLGAGKSAPPPRPVGRGALARPTPAGASPRGNGSSAPVEARKAAAPKVGGQPATGVRTPAAGKGPAARPATRSVPPPPVPIRSPVGLPRAAVPKVGLSRGSPTLRPVGPTGATPAPDRPDATVPAPAVSPAVPAPAVTPGSSAPPAAAALSPSAATSAPVVTSAPVARAAIVETARSAGSVGPHPTAVVAPVSSVDALSPGAPLAPLEPPAPARSSTPDGSGWPQREATRRVHAGEREPAREGALAAASPLAFTQAASASEWTPGSLLSARSHRSPAAELVHRWREAVASWSSSAGGHARLLAAPVQVSLSSLVGAGGALIFTAVAAFFTGRCSVAEGQGRALATARTALGAAREVVRSAVPAPPRPCWVARQPRRWAPVVAKSIPFEVAATGAGAFAVGYARDPAEAVGIEINPATGEVAARFSQRQTATIVSVSPVSSGQERFLVSRGDQGGLRSSVRVPAPSAFFVGLARGAIAVADGIGAEPSPLWPVAGDEELEAPRATIAGEKGVALTFRREKAIWGGWIGADRKPVGELTRVSGSGGVAGKPSSGWNGREIAVVFADRPLGTDRWEIRAGRAPGGAIPSSTKVIPLPDGGPGGDAFAPDIAGLPDGRWLLVWTEGPAGSRAMRAQTLAFDFSPVGDPIALSPPAGNFGQGILGVSSGYVGAVFLSRPAASYELWGVILQCG